MRRHPVSQLDTFGNFCPRTPNVLTGQGEQSENNRKYFLKPAYHEVKEGDIEMFAIQLHEEHVKMLFQQKKLTESCRIQENINVNATQRLYEDVAKLREGLINVNSFMQTCDGKILKANNIINNQKSKHAVTKAESAELKQNLKIMTEFRAKLEKTVKELEPYESVLHEAAKVQDIWTSVADCMNRCDALMLNHGEIHKMIDDSFNRMEQIRQEGTKKADEAISIIIGLTTTLSNMERDLVGARTFCLHWEKMLANIKHCLAEYESEKNVLMNAVVLIYRTICRSNGITPCFTTDERRLESMFDFIKREILILQGVYEECVKVMEQKKKPDKRRKSVHILVA